jgi:hypothetical protein
MGTAISRLEKWYSQRCNGDWEHQWGVSIDTLDNPGWLMKIGLRETRAEGRVLERTRIERSTNDWVEYWVADHHFQAACGPLNPFEAIKIFIDWFAS